MNEQRNLPLISGLFMLPALVFQQDLLFLGIQTLFLVMLQPILGKRIRVLPNLIMISTITALNLVQPYGRVLAEPFGFPVTVGALELGMRRSFMLISLIYLSKFMVIGSPRFPGRLGEMLSLQFSYYQGFLSTPVSLRPSQIIRSLDQLLLSLEATDGTVNVPQLPKRALVFCAASPVLIWVCFAMGILQ